MPYNATWIEPWMRPLKQIPRSRRTRKVVFRKLAKSGNKLEPILENSQESMNQGSNQTSSEYKRRATRLRRISASNNWSGKLDLNKTKGTKRPKSKKKKEKTKPSLNSIPLGSKI